MSSNIERSRFVVWLLVIIILILSFVLIIEKLEEDVDDAAFLLASKRMIERASFYKQQWMLNGQREHLVVDTENLLFSKHGWVIPNREQTRTACESWFSLLYPEQRVLGVAPSKVVERSELNNYRCEYIFNYGKSIHIQLVDNNFTVSVGFSAK
ncbi:MSHA biogenesis protein MshF [Vibrio sp. Isolate24]|uniref:MSHA biogenesis protein MshF n=1 Tax=Vibrio sp. Isolate24 TaxID=2908534 RepID=UPI001EFE7158|nr:MSHA biogenesis protein MshF [Vibrio sp. Isolate24]MCG9680721.1 MSHA biogenesis protein MshF [Vibrio sp. Isolate24]